MNRLLLGIMCLALPLSLIPVVPAHSESTNSTVRVGYIDAPGSGLTLLASARTMFNNEGLRVEVVKVASSEAGLEFLNSGALDAVAVDALAALREISANDRITVFSGSGYLSPGPLDELEADSPDKALPGRIVVVALRQRLSRDQGLFRSLVHALIRAYGQYFQNKGAALAAMHPDLSTATAGTTPPVYDPNPRYDSLARLWKEQGLQRKGQPRSYLSDHVNEEYFCDALYVLLEQTPKDPGLNQLLKRAVCPPDCCPIGKKAPPLGGVSK